jgi:iron complex transport system substrate-binding protein
MNESAIERPVTRRRLLAIGLAGGMSLLVGCGSAARSEAGWTFVDDRGHTVKLRRGPTRILPYTTAAAALYDWGVTPVGVFGDDPREDPSLADFAWGDVQIVGSGYGEIDPGALHALNAELIVSRWYPPPDEAQVFGFKELKQQRAIDSQVPIVGLNGHVIAARQIRANQIAAWQGDPPPSYQTYTRTLNDLALAIARWHKVN